MTKYETMLVTSARLDEAAAKAVVEKFTALIEANGTIDSVDDWGKRRLAYPIEKQEEGVYTLIRFTSGPDFPAELDRVYKITDGVLRTLILARNPEAILAEKAKEEAAKAREAAAKAQHAAAVEAKAKEAAAAAAAAEAAAVAEAAAATAEPAVEQTEQEASE